MRMRNEVWQGSFGYWQNQFIHHNILSIGHLAWSGHTNQGRGMVVCQVIDVIPSFIDWSVDAVTFDQTFVSQGQVARYLQALELTQDVAPALLKAIATYDPTKTIVVLVMGNGEVDINLLQDLAIEPADCYAQVQQRWSEFQPNFPHLKSHL